MEFTKKEDMPYCVGRDGGRLRSPMDLWEVYVRNCICILKNGRVGVSLTQ